MKFEDYNCDADDVKKFQDNSSTLSDEEDNQSTDTNSLPNPTTNKKIPKPILDLLLKTGDNSHSNFDSDLFNRNKSMADDIFNRINRQISDINKKFK